MRAFVAVDVPDVVEPRRSSSASTHLTLKFLGEIPPSVVAPLAEALAATLRDVPVFPLTVERVGAFPDTARPRVVWADVTTGRDEVTALAGRVEEAAAGAGLPREKRPFIPHVTVLRVRGPRDLERARQLLSEWADRTFGSTVIREVTLYESELRPEGAVHRPLARFPLAEGGAT